MTQRRDKTIDDLYVYNDEDIPVYPYIEITMMESGDLQVTNSQEADPTYITKIKNVSIGETIIMNNRKITSSNGTHTVIDDFNMKWLRFFNQDNRLSFNLSCNVTIKFREYRKLVVF